MRFRNALVNSLVFGGLGEGAAPGAEAAATFEAGALRLSLDGAGRVRQIRCTSTGRDLTPDVEPAPLVSIVVDGKRFTPAGMKADGARLNFSFEGHRAVGVTTESKATHLRFEIAEVCGEGMQAVLWGPFHTTIGETIGEVVGVVRDSEIAVGLQALTVHTMAGVPTEWDDDTPGSRERESEHAAVATPHGSALRAHVLDRRRTRSHASWNMARVDIPARDADWARIEGSAIALFACRAADALNTIGRIEEAEGLPHPILDGEWGKTSRTARLSYMITPFGEKDIEDHFEYVHRAGLMYLYQDGPFETWGHFTLLPKLFPDGDASMKRCSDLAAGAGIRLGYHTLSNFTTTNDPWVTPAPDPRLQRIGSTTLTADIDAEVDEIPVAEDWPFRERQDLAAAVIGEELVQYGGLSEGPPWKLVKCRRGAFKTNASPHAKGDDIGKLADHGYKTFYPNLDLQEEYVQRIADFTNETGMSQISFDGLEGCRATGEGVFACNLFVKGCWDRWNREVISDASNLNHYLWHIHTRMNWGEPWGKAMREGMTDYRFRNQAYFERNLWPRMLGWFQLRLAGADVEATNLMDIEWMLSKAAGYDAGFAIATSLQALRRNGQTGVCLDAVREWERARHAGAFSPEQRERLREPAGEFHLEAADGGWRLTPLARTVEFTHRVEDRQPGEPTSSTWQVENPFGAQPVRFVARVVSSGDPHARVRDVSIEIGIDTVTFPVELAARQYLVYEGGDTATVCDANWNELESVEIDGAAPMLASGANDVLFDCEGDEGIPPLVNVWFKTLGEEEFVADPEK